MVTRRPWLVVLAAAAFLTAASPASPLERPTPDQVESYRRDGTLATHIEAARRLGNHRIDPRLLDRARERLRRLAPGAPPAPSSEIEAVAPAPPTSWRGMPTEGTVKVLCLLIAFSDYGPTTSAQTINDRLFGAGTPSDSPYESLQSYYSRSSYGRLTITGNVLGWYTAPYGRSSVLQTNTGRESLIKEALNYYETNGGHDFSQYDNDGDGSIDYLIVIWTGPDNGWANFWWGYQTSFADSSYRLDGKKLGTYSWMWEANPYPGAFHPLVTIHETGHALGLPDYYDYDPTVGPTGGVGGLDMMDSNWGDHNAFSKFVLGWLTPTGAPGAGTPVTLAATGSSPEAILVMPNVTAGDPFQEYFIVQDRWRVGNDTAYPTDGALIWHVDARLNAQGTDYLYDNSYTAHKLLRLMEADGREQIERDLSADAGDYYGTGAIFGPATVPNSRRYDGTPSGVSIRVVSAAGSAMTFEVDPNLGTAAAPGPPVVPPANGTGAYNVSWDASPTPGAAYDLQEATDAGFSAGLRTASTGATTLSVTGRAGNATYYYRVRATAAGYGASAWVAGANGCAVTLPAEAPSSVPTVPSASDTGSYTVTWGASATTAATYEVEEATDPGFSAGLRTVSTGATTLPVTGRPGAFTYYYRVRATAVGYRASAWVAGANGCTVANHAPVLQAIGSKSVAEGALLSFAITTTDPDGTTPTLAAAPLPEGAQLTGDTFAWTPRFDQAGTYDVTFTASDSLLTASETVQITVSDVTYRVSLAVTPTDAGTVTGAGIYDPGATATLVPSPAGGYRFWTWSGDAEGEANPLTFTVGSDKAITARFVLLTPATVTALAKPPEGGAVDGGGLYDRGTTVTLTASAAAGYHFLGWAESLAGSPNPLDVTVLEDLVATALFQENRPPALAPIGPRTVPEGQTLRFTVTASDPDGDPVTLRAADLPTGATFTPATGLFRWTPAFGQEGNYPVTFVATDGWTPPLSDSETITVTVGHGNRPPIVDPVGPLAASEHTLVTFQASGTDPDGDAIRWAAGNLPPGASFDPSTGTFSWLPGYEQAGSYAVTVTATDSGTPPMAASLIVAIAVGEVNRPPILDPIGAQHVDEGGTLSFQVTAVDPDGDPLTFSGTGLPPGAAFDPTHQTFTWTPDFAAAGNYRLQLTVADSGTPPLSDAEEVTVTVGNTNRPPVLTPVGPRSVPEGEELSFVVGGSDPDGGSLTFAAGNLPPGAAFDASTRTFAWTPSFDQAGNYQVTFTVTDAGAPPLTDAETITLTAGDVNRPPVLGPIGDRTAPEGQALAFAVTATDPDGGPIAVRADGLPAGATFDAGTQTFQWTPGSSDEGVFRVLFVATDNGFPPLSAEQEVAITVTASDSGGGGGGGCFVSTAGQATSAPSGAARRWGVAVLGAVFVVALLARRRRSTCESER